MIPEDAPTFRVTIQSSDKGPFAIHIKMPETFSEWKKLQGLVQHLKTLPVKTVELCREGTSKNISLALLEETAGSVLEEATKPTTVFAEYTAALLCKLEETS